MRRVHCSQAWCVAEPPGWLVPENDPIGTDQRNIEETCHASQDVDRLRSCMGVLGPGLTVR